MVSTALYFVLPIIDAVVQTAGVSTAINRVDCVKANELCTGDPACSSKYRTLRQCLAGSASMVTGPEAKNECISAMEAVQQSPLYNCRCKRGMKNEKRCLRIYWSIHQSFMHGFTITGHDLVGSPYEPLNNRLSDIFRAASIISVLRYRFSPGYEHPVYVQPVHMDEHLGDWQDGFAGCCRAAGIFCRAGTLFAAAFLTCELFGLQTVHRNRTLL